MKRRLHNIWLLGLIACLMACSSNEAVIPMDECVTVNIVLSMGTSTHARTTTSDAGDTIDYHINAYDVEVLVYDNSGNYVETAIISAVVPISETTGQYKLTGSLKNISSMGGDYQVVALCNLNGTMKVNGLEKTSLEGTTLTHLIELLQFNYTTDYTTQLLQADRKTRIPMWGIVPSQLENGTTININVLRSLAKIRVSYLQKENPDYLLTKVSLSHAMAGGYLAAQNNQAIDTNGNTNFNDENQTGITEPSVANLSAFTGSDIPLSFVKTSADDADITTYIIYVPEYKNIGNDAPAVIDLTFVDKLTENPVSLTTPHLYFADYSKQSRPTANEWDIIRNDFYDYTITGVTEGNLAVSAKVTPWTVEESHIGWDTNSYEAKLGTDDTEARFCFICKPRYASSSSYPNHSGLEVENKSSEATYLFTLTGPKGAVWKAHLSNTDLFQLGKTAETGIAREAAYYINISAKEAWTEETDENGVIYPQSQFDRRLTEWGKKWELNGGPETDLYFTVTTDGLNEHEVIINPTGQGGGYKDGRLYPGTDTRVRIKQLRATRGDDYYEWGDSYK